jgi:hypothetical protein
MTSLPCMFPRLDVNKATSVTTSYQAAFHAPSGRHRDRARDNSIVADVWELLMVVQGLGFQADMLYEQCRLVCWDEASQHIPHHCLQPATIERLLTLPDDTVTIPAFTDPSTSLFPMRKALAHIRWIENHHPLSMQDARTAYRACYPATPRTSTDDHVLAAVLLRDTHCAQHTTLRAHVKGAITCLEQSYTDALDCMAIRHPNH